MFRCSTLWVFFCVFFSYNVFSFLLTTQILFICLQGDNLFQNVKSVCDKQWGGGGGGGMFGVN